SRQGALQAGAVKLDKLPAGGDPPWMPFVFAANGGVQATHGGHQLRRVAMGLNKHRVRVLGKQRPQVKGVKGGLEGPAPPWAVVLQLLQDFAVHSVGLSVAG